LNSTKVIMIAGKCCLTYIVVAVFFAFICIPHCM